MYKKNTAFVVMVPVYGKCFSDSRLFLSLLDVNDTDRTTVTRVFRTLSVFLRNLAPFCFPVVIPGKDFRTHTHTQTASNASVLIHDRFHDITSFFIPIFPKKMEIMQKSSLLLEQSMIEYQGAQWWILFVHVPIVTVWGHLLGFSRGFHPPHTLLLGNLF